MNRAVRIAVLSGCSYLAIRIVIIYTRHVMTAGWWPQLILVAAFGFSVWEIAWSKERFLALEDMIARLVASNYKGQARRWYRDAVAKMYDKSLLIVTGVLAIPLFIFLFRVSGWNAWISDVVLRRYDSISEILMLSAATSSQWPFFKISDFVVRLGRNQLSISFYEHPRGNIMSLGALLMKIDLGGLLLVFLITIALYLSPIRIPITVYGMLIGMYLWAGLWFFLTQNAIHKRMLEEKREDVRLVSERLTEALQGIRTDLNPMNQKRFEDLKRLYDQLDSLPNWPFDTKTVLTLASGVLIPILVILVMIAQIILKR